MQRYLAYWTLLIRSILETLRRCVAARLLGRTPGAYLEVDGLRLYYTVEGAGEPVILVHGFAVNADLNWRLTGVTRTLARHFQVISLDMRGHGRSSKPEAPEAYGAELAHDVIRLMDHLEIPKAHLVGYSMGGFTTLKVLTLYPDRLLSAAPCGAGFAEVDNENVARLVRVAGALVEGKGFAPLLDILEPEGPWRKMNIWIADKAMQSFNPQRPLGLLMQQFADLAVEESALQENTVPVLTIVGEIDPLREYADAMPPITAQHELNLIAGGNHLTALLKPSFIEHLVAFLNRHSNQQAPGQESAAALNTPMAS